MGADQYRLLSGHSDPRQRGRPAAARPANYRRQLYGVPKYQDYYDYMDELGCPHYFDNLPLYAIGL